VERKKKNLPLLLFETPAFFPYPPEVDFEFFSQVDPFFCFVARLKNLGNFQKSFFYSRIGYGFIPSLNRFFALFPPFPLRHSPFTPYGVLSFWYSVGDLSFFLIFFPLLG